MAQPVSFTPKSVDPKLELQRRLESAPNESAEALLVVYDILREAHNQGLLDAVHGAVAARDTIFGELANYGDEPETINALRNLMALGKLLGTVDPGVFSKVSRAFSAGDGQGQPEPPSLWELWRRSQQPEVRRGLSLMLGIVEALGSSGGKGR